VTIVAYGRELLFGQVVGDEIQLSEFGEIARDEWLASADIRREIRLDAFVIMPNHIHGIVWIVADDNHTAVRPYPHAGQHRNR
jgi:REP element-mobilizing transposase RayT